MKTATLRLFMAVDADGSPRFTNGGTCLPLGRAADDARMGWGMGFARPGVVEVEVRWPVRKPPRSRARRGRA